jgi:hypothetical protein
MSHVENFRRLQWIFFARDVKKNGDVYFEQSVASILWAWSIRWTTCLWLTTKLWNKFEYFPLSYEFCPWLKIPVLQRPFYVMTDEDLSFIFALSLETYVVDTEALLQSGSWRSQNLSSAKGWCEVKVGLLSVDRRAVYLPCPFDREETVYF